MELDKINQVDNVMWLSFELLFELAAKSITRMLKITNLESSKKMHAFINIKQTYNTSLPFDHQCVEYHKYFIQNILVFL